MFHVLSMQEQSYKTSGWMCHCNFGIQRMSILAKSFFLANDISHATITTAATVIPVRPINTVYAFLHVPQFARFDSSCIFFLAHSSLLPWAVHMKLCRVYLICVDFSVKIRQNVHTYMRRPWYLKAK